MAFLTSNVREVFLARLFVVIGGFVVVVLMAALIAPLFIDWTGYRADFEREASKILGQPVTVAGGARARILPFPSLSFSTIRVGADVENPALTIEQFSLDAELAPFLSGEILIFDMRVTKPRGVINIDADGAIDWMVRPSLSVGSLTVSIEKMVIEDGQFLVSDQASQRTHTVSLARATVSAKALQGPWRLVGSASINGEPLQLTLATGQIEDGVLPVTLSAFATQQSLVVETEGSVKLNGNRPRYAGQFTLRPALIPEATPDPAITISTAIADAFKVTGQFGLTASGLALTEFKLETGSPENRYSANGSGSIIFGLLPMFELNLAGTQMTLANDPANEDGAALGLEKRIETFQTFVDAVPFPSMPGSINVNLPAIVIGDTTLGDIAFTATPEKGAWRVRNFKATLPGRSKLEADGLLNRGDAFGFSGTLLLASTQPAGLIKWLNGTRDTVLRKVAAVGFSSKVRLSATLQSFSDLELALGNAILTGTAERRSDGTRPFVALTLKGGALDLSEFSGHSSLDMAAGATEIFEGHDVTLTLDAGPILQNEIDIAQVGMSLRLKQENVEIDRLMLTDVAGTSVSATGALRDITGAASGNLDMSLTSVNGGAFLQLLARRFPDTGLLQTAATRLELVPELLTDLRSSVLVSTAQEAGTRAFTISMNARTKTGHYVFGGNLNGLGTAVIAGSLQASIQEQDPLTLVALAGVPLIPLGAPGPAVLEFSGIGDTLNGFVSTAQFNAPGTSAKFDGSVSGVAPEIIASGRLRVRSDDADPYLIATGMVFSGVGTGTAVDLDAGVKANAQALKFSDIDSRINDTDLSGNLDLAFGVRPEISGTVRVNHLTIGWLGENLFGLGAFDLGAVDPDKATAFVTTPVAPFDGQLAFSADVMDLGRLGQATGATGTLGLTANSVRLEKVKANVAGGAVTGSLDMRNDGGNGAMSGEFALSNAQIQSVPFLSPMTGAVDMAGSISSSGKTLDGLTAALAGSGVARLREGVITGLNPDGLTAILAASQTSDKPPSVTDVEKLIASSVRTGRFEIKASDIAWTLAGGQLRMPGVSGKAGSATLSVDIAGDMRSFGVQADGSVAYAAGKDSVVGAEPTVPFVAKILDEKVEITTNPQPLLQFLTQAVLEREQARVEALQSALVEKQRLRKDVALVAALYNAQNKKIRLREEATRAQAARDGARLSNQWELEKNRLILKNAQEKREQEKRDLDLQGDEKARKEALELLKDEAAPNTNPVPNRPLKLDGFKGIEFALP